MDAARSRIATPSLQWACNRANNQGWALIRLGPALEGDFALHMHKCSLSRRKVPVKWLNSVLSVGQNALVEQHLCFAQLPA
jgi:hypothetical protein